MWDIRGDNFGTCDDVGELEIVQLSLDELELETLSSLMKEMEIQLMRNRMRKKIL